MPIRLSGLSSGLDTEALVSALVSSYSLKKDNYTKAQTKVQWKQDAWKTMNTSIYSFYSGKLSSARMSATYNLKSASISNSSFAKVTASSSAVNGTQTLEIKKLAATGYLTGGVISGQDADGNDVKLSSSSKLSEIKGMSASSSINVTVDGKEQTIQLDGDMSINSFVAKLKDAGLNANFDEANQRFFISSKTSGKDHDFSLTAGSLSGVDALNSMGIFVADTNSKDYEEYSKWAALAGQDPSDTTSDLFKAIESEYNNNKISYEDRAKEYADKYNNAKTANENLAKSDTWVRDAGGNINLAASKSSLEALKQDLIDKYALKNDSGELIDKDGNVLDADAEPVYDVDALKESGDLADYNVAKTNISNMEKQISSYEANLAIMDGTKDYVTFNAEGKAVAASADNDPVAYANIVAEVDSENADIYEAAKNTIQNNIEAATKALATSSTSDAVRIKGEDAEIVLNKATFTNNTNNFSINGLTIQATAVTNGENVTITTDTDIDGIYNSVKDFFKEYNELLKAMDSAYNATSSKGYEPLTSEEKEAMSDDEVEKWETKIKDSLLRKDSTLGNTSSALKNLMAQAIEVNGKKYSLASFGIKTLGYFEAADNEKGLYHIDGDKDDGSTSGNTDKLRAALANDPDTFVEFFSKLTNAVYTDLGKRMASTSMSSIYTIYNDKEMGKEYSEYNTKISDLEDQIKTWEDYYYKKFSSMESALSTLNSQQSSLSGYFG